MSMKDTPSPTEQLYEAVCAGNVPANVYTSNDGTSRISAFKTGVSYLKLKDTCPDLSELKSWEYEKGTQTLIFAWSSGRTTRFPSLAAPDTPTGASNTESPTVSEQSPTVGSAISKERPDNSHAVGLKYDEGKLPWNLIPPESIEQILEILDFGQRKYAAWNWAKGISYSRVFSATMRHLWAWYRGEENDPETSKSHLAHAAACIVFLLYFTKYRESYKNFDDRKIRT